MPIVLCRMLGPLQITVDDLPAPQPLLWKKPLGLLVYLLRAPHRTRSREHLVSLFWPDSSESSAKHSLNEALSKLRRAAGESAVLSSGDAVTLGPQFACDLDEFETAMARGDWETAAQLCGGELAEGLSVPGVVEFDQWIEGERRHWRGQGVLALGNWALQLLDRGRTRAAVEAAHRALALDPLSEHATQAVMRARLLLGDRRGALETGREFARRLASDLGAEPAPETLALMDQARPPAGTASTRWTDDSPRPPLAGREGEMSSLMRLFERTRTSREASLAVVIGEPGTGVSRLLQELVARARLDGASVARVVAVAADCDEAWSGVAGLALGGLLHAPGVTAAPAASLATFAERLVPWRERFGAAVGLGDESPAHALAEVVAAAADERPVLLVLDDAQRLDEETLRALPRMLRRWRELPVMVAVGASPTEERPALDELRLSAGRDLSGLALQLGPLTVQAIRELAAGVLPTYGPVELDRVVRRVVTDSAGMPLLALELLNAVSRGLELRATAKAWPATSATLDDTLPSDVPDAIVAAIRVNFRRLSRSARDVLTAAAVLGERVSPAELARVTEMPQPELDAALDELEWHHWLSSEGRGYSFIARLARRVVGEDMLTPGQRRRVLERAQGTDSGSEGS